MAHGTSSNSTVAEQNGDLDDDIGGELGKPTKLVPVIIQAPPQAAMYSEAISAKIFD